MENNTFTIGIVILGVGVALAGLLLNGLYRLDKKIDGVAQGLDKKIEDKAQRLDKRIEDVAQSLDKKIEELVQGQSALRERMAHLEGLLEGLREAVTGRRDAA